jgi:hypothetical protein
LLNSRLGHFSAPLSRFSREDLHELGGLFSRSYETNLPSSLTKGRPFTWVYSTSPPVSVCGTGAVVLARGFSRQPGISTIAHPCGCAFHHLSVNAIADLPTTAPYQLGGLAARYLPSCVPPSLITNPSGTGISTCCPSATPRGLALGPTNPRRINLASEPSGLRCGGFTPPLRYSYRHSHFRSLQACFRSPFPAVRNAPLPSRPKGLGSIASVLHLSPDGLSAPDHTGPVSCYALFKGWLLLSQPPGCLCNPTALPT